MTIRFAVAAMIMLGAVNVAAADPLGAWRDRDGATIRVHHCGNALCGTIIAMEPPNDPSTGNPWTDKHNPDETKRGEPLIGLQVFIDMQPAGPGKWTGRLYSTNDGHGLRGNLIDRGPNTLRVEGCVGSRCGGRDLRRVGD
jgi:uncharacterized protein (DUF2147 family)